MSRVATWSILLSTLGIVLVWNWAHHTYMWGGAALVYWCGGVLAYILKPMFLWGLILYASWVIGRWLVRDWLVAVVLGLGTWGTLVWLVSLCQGLHYGILQMAVLGVCFYGVWKYFPKKWGFPKQEIWHNWEWYDKLLLAVIIWWVLRTAFIAFNPSTGFDAIHAHLWQNKNFILAGGYVYDPFHTNFALAHCITMLQQLMGGGDPGAIVQYTAYLITAGFLCRIGTWLGDRTTGLMCALLFMITPVFYFMAQEWFSGMVMLMFLAAAGWWLTHYYTRIKVARPTVGLLSVDAMVQIRKFNVALVKIPPGGEVEILFKWSAFGLLLGFAIATKLSCGPLVLLMIILCGKNWWRVLLWLAIAAAPFLLVNLAQHGNPFWPFRQEWFTWWPFPTMPDTEYYARPTLPETWMPWRGFIQNFWYNNSPIAKPFEMTISGPWCLALTVPIVATLWKWTRPVWVLAGIVVLLYLYWWGVEGIFHSRYMSYVFMCHVLLGGWALVNLMKGDK